MEMPLYKVQLDQFEGPLDLLLYFIRRDEIDDLMDAGSKKAEIIASETLSSVKKSIGMV